mgnify:FL=1
MNPNHSNTERYATMPAAPEQDPVASAGEPVQRVARLNSQVLLAGAQEIEIEHHGVLYRLRQTALGKLILTK